jgi:acetyl esterase/lipase
MRKLLLVVLVAALLLSAGARSDEAGTAGAPAKNDPVALAVADDKDLLTHTPEVIYGRKDGVALTFDVFTPKKEANGATVLFMVSGGWVSDRVGFAPLYLPAVRAFVKRGYTVFTVGHGRQPRFTIPDAVAHIHRAVRYIRYHAKDYAIDGERFGISGFSSGGHLSLMLGTGGDAGNKNAADPVERASSQVQAVACFFPPTDFLNYGEKGKVAFAIDGPLANFRPAIDVRELNPKTKRFEHLTDEKKVEELYKKVSPITHVTANSAPSLIVHGDADKLVPIQQAEVMVAALEKAGVAAKLIAKKGVAHGWPGMYKDIPALADWFDTHLKKK